MHFGLYLKKQGLITAEQLVAALEAQHDALIPIGQLALEEGILSARDIFNVLQAQSEAPNERFGELAVEMRLMTRKDLMRLLMIQADRKRPIVEILVSQGVLSERDVAMELTAYRRSKLRPQRRTPMVKPISRRHESEHAGMSSDELITV